MSGVTPLLEISNIFFRSWASLGRVAAVAAIVFMVVVALLRLVGQQALAKMSGYDAVVTISLGSILASVMLTRDVTVSDAVVAIVTLFVLQEATRRLQVRWLTIHHFVREPPRVVLWNGQLLEDRLVKYSVSGDEVRAAVRQAGYSSLQQVLIVVLENDGDWSVVAKSEDGTDHSALFGLAIPGKRSDGSAGATRGDNSSSRTAPPGRLP